MFVIRLPAPPIGVTDRDRDFRRTEQRLESEDSVDSCCIKGKKLGEEPDVLDGFPVARGESAIAE